MKRVISVISILCITVLSFSLPNLKAQEQPNPRTMLPESLLQIMADTVSGSLAHHSAMELGGWEHTRNADEYSDMYRESRFIVEKAKEYGFTDAHVEKFPQQNKTWGGEMGEFWVVEPNPRLVVSYRDVPLSLASGSRDSDVTAELIYVGRGDRPEDYENKDVKGKIVIGSGSIGTMHNLAVRRYGAEGVATFLNSTGKPIDRPDEISYSSIGGGGGGGQQGGQPAKTTFGFVLSHRMGMELLDQLEKGQKVKVHAKVKATEYTADMQVPTAIIPGDGSTDQEIGMSGHLFEGIAKQGAADDMSGCATILEAGRAYIKLIKDGVLPKPKRTIRFLWVPEISGTNAYLNKYPEEAKKMIANINIDMAGEDVTKNHNSLHLFRTPTSTPTYLNDVCEQFFRFVGDTNREKVHNRRIAYAFMWPIFDPSGTRDPFYFDIEKHYGSSDHTAYLNHGIASVLFNNWPDYVYHTNQDRPDMLDPTQMKRAAFISLASAYIIASAGAAEAPKVAALTAGYGNERIGRELGEALALITSSTKSDLMTNYKEATVIVEEAFNREAAAVSSTEIFAGKDQSSVARIRLVRAGLMGGLNNQLAQLKNYYAITAASLGVSVTEPAMSADEQTASKLVPVRKLTGGTGGGGRGPGGGGAQAALTGFHASEARAFVDGNRSVLDIRNAISAELGPVDIQKVLAFFTDLEKSGQMELKHK